MSVCAFNSLLLSRSLKMNTALYYDVKFQNQCQTNDSMLFAKVFFYLEFSVL